MHVFRYFVIYVVRIVFSSLLSYIVILAVCSYRFALFMQFVISLVLHVFLYLGGSSLCLSLFM